VTEVQAMQEFIIEQVTFSLLLMQLQLIMFTNYYCNHQALIYIMISKAFTKIGNSKNLILVRNLIKKFKDDVIILEEISLHKNVNKSSKNWD